MRQLIVRGAKVKLPFHLSSFYCGLAITRINEDNMEDCFPKEFINRLNDAGSSLFGNGIDITQEDIEHLNNKAWNYIIKTLEGDHINEQI